MTLLWLITGASLAMAFAAWSRARRIGRRLDQLTEMYWELKYQAGELRAQVQRSRGGEPEPVATPAPQRPADGFIPLTSLRR